MKWMLEQLRLQERQFAEIALEAKRETGGTFGEKKTYTAG